MVFQQPKGDFLVLNFMWDLFKSNPISKLEKQRQKMLEEAMHTQRSGDLKKYAFQMEAIDKLEKEIDALRTKKNSPN